MALEHSFVPYGQYWSTPFCRWQGSFAHLHPVIFAASVCKAAMAKRGIVPDGIDSVLLGTTVPQKHSLYTGPWFTSLLGVPKTGSVVSQAEATGIKALESAAYELAVNASNIVLVTTTDKMSNGPHLVFPQSHAPGATPESEDFVWDSFGFDPWSKNPMIQTAENVAQEGSFSKDAQDKLAIMRYEQYKEALKDECAFLKRFMDLPFKVKDAQDNKDIKELAQDEGPFEPKEDDLAKLRPVMPEGTVTFGTQTYPADGNASMIVCSKEKAEELSTDKNITVQLLSFAHSRVRKGFMAMAAVPAAELALERAGRTVTDISVLKTHNPFCVSDLHLSKELGFPLESFNHYGSSLIWGNPIAAAATRLLIELIEELALKGGGYGLFAGCSSGDSGMAAVLKVDVKS